MFKQNYMNMYKTNLLTFKKTTDKCIYLKRTPQKILNRRKIIGNNYNYVFIICVKGNFGLRQ